METCGILKHIARGKNNKNCTIIEVRKILDVNLAPVYSYIEEYWAAF